MSKLYYLLVFLGIGQILVAQNESFSTIRQQVEQSGMESAKLFRVFETTQNTEHKGAQPTKAQYFSLNQHDLIALRSGNQYYLEVEIPQETENNLTLELIAVSPYSEDFGFSTSSGHKTLGYDLGKHFRGVVKGDQSSLVAFSVYENEVMGLIVTKGQHFNLGKIENDKQNRHILYAEDDFEIEKKFGCATDDTVHAFPTTSTSEERTSAANSVNVYMETDFTLFQNKGSVTAVVNYMGGLMNQVTTLYANDGITLKMSYLYVWDKADPYIGPTSNNYLDQFRVAKNGVFNGNIAHLVALTPSLGGIAYVNVPCNKAYGVGFTGIDPTFNNVPTYSWSVYSVAHELGHNLGSKHTHACAWNGNNTAIDGCGPAANANEGCTAAIPATGTLMSYCHLLPGVGVNFANGFGVQPGTLIRNTINAATCLATVGTGVIPCTPSQLLKESFETGLGIWIDGGIDCERRLGAATATDGSYAIRLRDNTTTSNITSNNLNLSGYSNITVSFGYLANFFEPTEGFWLQISLNGGVTWTTLVDLNAGTEFQNNQKKTHSITATLPFSTATKLRFVADASDDDDVVYIDNFNLTGCLKPVAPPTQKTEEFDHPTIEQSITLSPNPASQFVQIKFNSDSANDFTLVNLAGQVIKSQNFAQRASDYTENIDLTGVPSGVYLVTIRNKSGVQTAKLLVQ
jgi:Metallo-peptidase family M12/Secretion system C-terminal sorting domain